MFKNLFSSGTQRLFLSIVLLCIFGIVLIGGYSWNVISDAMFAQIEKTSHMQMQKANLEINNLVESIQEIVADIENLNLLYKDKPTLEDDVNTCLSRIIDAEIYGAGLLITSDGREYLFNPDLLYMDTVHLRISCRVDNPEKKLLNWYNGANNDFFPRYDGYYIVSTSVLETEDTYASLYLFIKDNKVNDILKRAEDRNNVVLLLDGGSLLATSDKDRLEHLKKTADEILFQLYEEEEGFFIFRPYDESHIMSYFGSPESEFKFTAIYKTSEVYKESNKILFIVWIIMAGFILVIVALYRMIKKQYIKPFSALVEQMKNMENNLEDEYIDIHGNQEINILVSQYNEMRRKISVMIEDVKHQEEMKRKAEVAALRYQINPHFFYNTLSNIKMLALSKGEHEISTTISKFANVYKYLFSNKSNFVMLGEEIEFIKNYISLMNARYDNLLSTFYMIDDHLKECILPVFILQPIVENAIVHGLSKKLNERTPCCLRIAVTRDSDMLVIEVHDDGRGMSSQMVEKIMSIKETEVQEFGLGFYNTIKRLQFQYGDNYSFSVESKPDEYTKITLKIPMELELNSKS